MIRYCITDRMQADVIDTARRAIDAGTEMLQIREKALEAAELLDLVIRVVEIAGGTSTKVLVNDRLDVALAAGADGVHLPGDGLPIRLIRSHIALIGVSTHTIAEVRNAEVGGADFVVFGPIFDTPGKTATGLTLLEEACSAVEIPVLAIGGMNEENTPTATRAGAAGIAGIRMFL